MQRYFVEQVFTNETEPIVLSGSDHHHVDRVMRMAPGDKVYLVFPDQRLCVAEILAIGEQQTTLQWLHWETSTSELPVAITIASGLPKGDKLDWIVQKGTELGAAGFLTFQSERSIVKWDAKKTMKKQERLQKIAKEAAEQSHRTTIPVVEMLANTKELASKATDFDLVIVADEERAKAAEKAVLATVFAQLRPGMRLLVVFGPEGGISEAERSLFQTLGAHFAGLGPRILRTETAPLYLLAAASYHFELNNV